MEDLEEKIKAEYAYRDGEVLNHGYNYFLTASKIYQNWGAGSSYAVYPLLTLLGISAELFLKAFDVTVDEKYEGSSMISKSVEPNKRIHDLKELSRRYSIKDQELFGYLVSSYKTDTGRDLQEDLSDYASVFVESRYIFQDDKGKYLGDIDKIFQLVKSLYDAIDSLYKNKTNSDSTAKGR